MKRITALLVFTLLLVGCAKNATAPHPGAIDNLDSYAYDVLIVDQGVINQAKTECCQPSNEHGLPAEAKGPLNTSISAYNVAESSWQSYHAGGGNGSALQKAI